ncbi:MAG: homoserine dehydrogenase, partial [Cryobacterium sp.]|nr:homoserine dehydrogenase [Cryobacterium sp.]
PLVAAGHSGHSGTAGHEPPPSTATLVIGTHEASEAALAATVTALAANSVVITVASVLRVEGA